jgi:hypothetical protein
MAPGSGEASRSRRGVNSWLPDGVSPPLVPSNAALFADGWTASKTEGVSASKRDPRRAPVRLGGAIRGEVLALAVDAALKLLELGGGPGQDVSDSPQPAIFRATVGRIWTR